MSSFFTGTFRGLSERIKYHKGAIQRAISYVIERYLGAFTSISQKQLDWNVSLSKQEFVVKNIDLKPKAVNDVLDDFPCKVVEGYVGRMSATIPWLELSTIPTDIHLKEVDITLRPKAPTSKAAQLLEAMSESMIHSMDASIRFAEETVTRETKRGCAEGYKDTSERNHAVSWMAGQLERIKNMVHFVAEDITVRIEIVEDQKVVGMEIRIDRLEFFDDQVVKAREGLGVDADVSSMVAWLIKNIQMKGISIYLDHQPMPFFSGTMPDSAGTSPSDLYMSAMEESMEDKSSLDPHHEKEESEPPRATPLHIATVAGRADVKLQMKSKESVEGPKIDVSIHFGAFHSLLSPKQVESLTKILSCYATPPEPDFESKKAGALNWHMGPEDYAWVGQVLERDMRSGRFEDVTEPFSEDCNYLANGDPMFHTMEPVPTTGAADMNLSVSSLDSASTLSTIPTLALSESEQRQQEKSARKARESAARAANEPSTDRSHYQLTVATVSVCLLHEELQEQGDLEWVNSVQALAAAYFQGLRHVSTAGQILSLKQLRDRISEVVPKDHLGLLCKPLTVNMSERTVRSTETFQVDMSIHQTELVECLFGSTPQSCFHEAPVKVPQYCEIVTFSNELRVADPGGASLPLSLDSLGPAIQVGVKINSRTGPYGYTYKETKVKVDLGNLMTEVDITIQDRLSTLLTTLTGLGTSPYASSQPLVDRDQQFHQAMEDVMQSNNALDLDLSCHHATARIRFPIPDLRPPNQHAPREWWGRNLHKESLLLEIEQLSLLKYSSPEAPSSTPSGVEVMCNKLDVYFQEDFNKTPRLFGSIVQGTGDVGDNFNRPRVVIKSFPPVGSSLMDTQEEVDMEQSSGGLGSLDENDPMFTRPGSTPFSLRREIVHGSRAFEEDDRAGFNSMFERVAPGNKEEMLNFMDMATSNTALLVDITAPKVLLTIHEKQVLELLYNRINNDLLLWQPQSPSSPETFASGQSLNIQPQYLNPDLVTSCSDSNDSDSVEDFTSASQLPRRRSPSFCHPSDICLSINIGEGKVFACVQMREEEGKVSEGLHGELALLVKDASMFVSVGHEGNKDLRYVTISANRAQLYHAGRVKNSRPPVSMEHLDTLTFDSKGCFGHMQSRIIRSEPSVPVEPLKDVGTGESSEDMVAVAIRIKVDNWNNNKYFLVAAAIRGATLRHEKHWSGEGWIQQIMELVDLTDYPIEGYVMPEVLTDLNIGLMGCAVDYRPKDFSIKSLRSLLTVQKFSLAVNINTSTKYTTMKFLFDEVNLWLSEKAGMEVNVDRDYLRIGHVGLLEVGLRLGQAFHQGSKTLVWFGNNKIEFKFCSDSCAAFINLLDHYINDRDLAKPQDPALALAEELPSLNLDERTEAQNLHVEQSIAEALEEHFTPSASPDDSPVKGGGRPLYFSPQGVEQLSDLSAGADGVVLPELSSDLNVSVDEDEEEEEFTIINDFGMGLTSKDASEDNVFINEDEDVLSQLENCCKSEANILAEDLKTPTGWPVPEFKCVLRELNLDICIHDGNDFGSNAASSQEKRKEEKTLWTTSKDAKKKVTDRKTGDQPWKGGVNRSCDVMVRMVMYKFRLRYEIYDESEERSRRLVAVWRKVEIEDHLEVSPYNKFLYWPDHNISNEGTNMLCLKVNWERPDARYNTEEVSIRLMMQSIKLHVNQDTQRFIQKFFTNVAEAMSPDDLPAVQRDPSPSPSSTPRRKKSLSAERAPIFSTEGGEPKQDQTSIVDDSLMHFGESPSGARAKCRPERPPRIDVEPEDNPVFFKSFVMSHDVTVTVDYTGTGAGISASNIKTMASTAIQGVLRIESVPITLKAIELQRGYKGLGKLVEAILMEWQHNIITKQLPSVVGGIGPISIVKTIIQGILDFFRLPLEQYRKDGRVWRGFQKGALSLKTATQTALLDLLKKVIESVMVCSSVCFDILSSSKHPNRIRDLKKTPKDLREGMSGAVTVVKEGISGTLQDLIRDASQQKEQKGLPGAMGYIIKNMPATVCAMPVQVLSAGADQCVTGIRHEIRPDLLKETQEKYKDMN